jgi:iron complex outermembrane receptor protein
MDRPVSISDVTVDRRNVIILHFDLRRRDSMMSVRTNLMASCCALAVAAPGVALAQDDDVTVIEEVVVSGAPYAVSIDSATTHVDVLDAADLSRAGAASLGDLLGGLPGVRSTAYAPGASRPVIRGQSGQRVLVLQNGVGLIDASALSPDHAVAASPGQASRIEVLRGPSALAYGGTAIGGIVNVLDERISSHQPENGLEAAATASAETVNDGAAANFSARKSVSDWVVSLDGEARDTDDYETPVRHVSDILAQAEGLTPLADRTQHNTDLRLRGYGAGVSRILDAGYVGVSVKRSETEYGIPFLQTGEPLEEGPIGIDLVQTRLDARGEFPIDIAQFDKVRFAAGYADYRHAEIDRGAGEIGTQFFSHGAEGRVEFIRDAGDGLQRAFGLQGLRSSLSAVGDEAFIPPSQTRDAAVFALQRHDYGAWGVEAGLRFDASRIDAELAGRTTSEIAQAFGLDWSAAPATARFEQVSASAGVFARPADDLFLGLSVSRNARAPTQFELYSDGPHEGTETYQVGDPTLTSEKVTSAEATVRYSRDRFRFEGHLYFAGYDGFIDERPTGERVGDDGDPAEDELPVFRFVQTDAEFYGGELEAGYELVRTPTGSLWLDLIADHVRGDTDLGPAARVPPPSLTARLGWEALRWDADLSVRTIAHQDTVAPFELETDGHTSVDASFGYRPFEDREVTLFLDVTNLTDAEIREHVSFLKDIAPAPGRSFRLGVTARY